MPKFFIKPPEQRRNSGERHYSHKLTAENVLEIRRLAGTVTYRELGARFGVSDVAAFKAATRETWKEIP